ncbi:endoglucanase II [Coprinopsis cinerea okayama7|uniref:AA9 family lytic polysaccharide monooxygenase n=1 Tax=Coprinopsis cinerea (strain Okayama-7 / 130 / ATCC MYA-4618 / FGSC 9003) TaxID=240176 RepID=A8NRC9_COPC7|nr:endoglucanase II [Coprinopsis cinerea okayama7\|eukprot:XP_001835755.1 endoglucanase II [Coprinopsis cinerea okayama7\
MKNLFSLATLAVLLSSVSAHTIFQELHVNGVRQGRTVGIRVPYYNGPIENVNSNDIICNGGINPYKTPISQTVIPVPAGATVTAEWRYTLDSKPGDNSDPIDPSHKGPILAYLAKVPSATQSNVTGLKWFKIYHDGYDAATNTWAVDKLIRDQGLVSFKIPDCIEDGDYLLRVELIALHSASSYPGAQFYMECAQIRISGGGNVTPSNTVSFPGAYSGSDPGVRINIYQGVRSYTIPGPSVWTCPAGSGPGNPAPTTPAPPVVPTTVAPPPVQTTAPPTTPPSQGTVPQWGQCGGNGYSGPTECVAPFRCVKTNDWYSQCVA